MKEKDIRLILKYLSSNNYIKLVLPINDCVEELNTILYIEN